MATPALSALLAHRRRAAVLLLAALVALLLAAAPGDLGPVAARSALAVGGLGALVALARRGAPRPRLAVGLALLETHPLARESGIALVEAGGRRFLVGFGSAGVRILRDLGPAPQEDGP